MLVDSEDRDESMIEAAVWAPSPAIALWDEEKITRELIAQTRADAIGAPGGCASTGCYDSTQPPAKRK